MKVDGKTIPAPQNIRRREPFLLTHSDKLPKEYVQAQLLKIALERGRKKLRWELPQIARAPRQDVKSEFKIIPKKQGVIDRIKGILKSQRGQ